MKCEKCGEKNVSYANYCRNCKYKFSDKERKLAKSKTVVGKIEKVEKAYNVCTLGVITGSTIYKVISLLVVIIAGVIFYLGHGRDIKLLESKNYEIQYNTKTKEYYLLTNVEKTPIELYVPNRANSVVIKKLDSNNKVIETFNYGQNKKLVLDVNDSGEYFLLEATYNNKEKDKQKISVYRMVD